MPFGGRCPLIADAGPEAVRQLSADFGRRRRRYLWQRLSRCLSRSTPPECHRQSSFGEVLATRITLRLPPSAIGGPTDQADRVAQVGIRRQVHVDMARGPVADIRDVAT